MRIIHGSDEKTRNRIVVTGEIEIDVEQRLSSVAVSVKRTRRGVNNSSRGPL